MSLTANEEQLLKELRVELEAADDTTYGGMCHGDVLAERIEALEAKKATTDQEGSNG